MDNSQTFIYAIGSLLGVLGQIVVIIACIILISKKKNPATMLMLIASILALVVTILNFSGNIIAAQAGVDSVLTWSKIFALIGPLPYVLFAIGLILFATNHVKKLEDFQ